MYSEYLANHYPPVIYYASNVFVSLGLTGGTIALLATGVTGVVFLISTIPGMLVIDKFGRKPMLLAGSLLMLASMVIVGVIVAKFQHDWPHHVAAGWTAVGESLISILTVIYQLLTYPL